jgi:ring-1,2-phenylacetyl-CoA epoxidase subunit PaaD
MVAVGVNDDIERLFDLLGGVSDPEIPVLSLLDLGVVRDVSIHGGKVSVTITPTYAGCPAMAAMRADIESTLAAAGYAEVEVRQTLSPAWSTDWMTQRGREKLRDYGIAPPQPVARGQQGEGTECPRCRSDNVKKISEFGSTACKALYQCRDCREPFDYFKCL